jgi:hypothetical protein
MRKQTDTQHAFRNSTCRDLGHDWMTTATANYRVCKREKCCASERLVAGQWESLAPFYRRHHPVVPTGRRPRQAAMWETDH